MLSHLNVLCKWGFGVLGFWGFVLLSVDLHHSLHFKSEVMLVMLMVVDLRVSYLPS